MVKAYLRYELADTWGVITSRSDICHSRDGKFLFTAALERVAVWSLKQAIVLRHLDAPESLAMGKSRPVTCMAVSSSTNQIAVGYGDGSIRVWNTSSWELETTLSGHTGAVTCLCFSPSGDRLASGSQDTDLILWDVSSEAGLFKLRGHKGQVTDLAFVDSAYLITTSKDEHIKVWDLSAERCMQTLLCHGGELWSVAYNPTTQRVVVGTSDSELRVFRVDVHVDSNHNNVIVDIGTVRRSTGDRVSKCCFVQMSEDEEYLVCQGAGKVVDVWRVRSAKEADKRKRKREKRKEEKKNKNKKKKTKEGDSADADEGAVLNDTDQEDAVKASDELELVSTIRSKTKLANFAVHPGATSRKSLMSMVLATSNNMLELWEIKEGKDPIKKATIDCMGHRSDVRSLSLSSDDALCLSTSNSGAKVWNPRKGICVSSIESGYGICSLFAPGNKHAIVGTKEGTIEVLDIGSSSRTEVVDAHEGPVWSVCLNPDGSGFVSGSADKTVKFWDWTIVESASDGEDDDDQGPSTVPRLSIECTQTLTLPDDVLSVKFTPNGALLIASLLDSTVKVYFADTLKFFLSLYGHKLPVLSMDVSSDSTLLVTGSADKNVKIWGLDYGDCHKSIFAHDDSVMAVAFVPDTHYFFTAGKDKLVKYWDADKFEHLLDLPGHHSEVWALKVSSLGDFVVSGGHDRSIRRFEKTEEAFFVEEEKEKRLESLFEEDLDAPDRGPLEGVPGIPGADDGSGHNTSAIAGKRTLETVSAADSIVEALDMAASEEERIKESRKALRESDYVPNPLLLGLSPSNYVLRAIGRVRASDLEQALILVPFMDALRLLDFCASWLKQGADVELLARISILLCRIHLQQLMATPAARATLVELRSLLQDRLKEMKDTWGYNAAAFEFLKRSKSSGISDAIASTAAKLRVNYQ